MKCEREISGGWLGERLGRVHAPAGLWERVRCPEPRKSAPRLTQKQTVWAAACLSIAIAAAGAFYARSRPAPENLALRSNRAGEIRSWIRARTGFDVPLPEQPPAEVRLIGASLISDAVEISYTAGGHEAKLLVSKAGPDMAVNGGHRFLGRGTRTSWVMGGQLYTLACAGPEERIACMLCHAGPDWQIAVN